MLYDKYGDYLNFITVENIATGLSQNTLHFFKHICPTLLLPEAILKVLFVFLDYSMVAASVLLINSKHLSFVVIFILIKSQKSLDQCCRSSE